MWFYIQTQFVRLNTLYFYCDKCTYMRVCIMYVNTCIFMLLRFHVLQPLSSYFMRCEACHHVQIYPISCYILSEVYQLRRLNLSYTKYINCAQNMRKVDYRSVICARLFLAFTNRNNCTAGNFNSKYGNNIFKVPTLNILFKLKIKTY